MSEFIPGVDIRANIALPKRWQAAANPRVPYQKYPRIPYRAAVGKDEKTPVDSPGQGRFKFSRKRRESKTSNLVIENLTYKENKTTILNKDEDRIRFMNDLLEEHAAPARIDYLSVDTEGLDATILESMPDQMRPRLIICEVDKNGVRERIEKEMDRRGYRFLWGTYLNSAYASS